MTWRRRLQSGTLLWGGVLLVVAWLIVPLEGLRQGVSAEAAGQAERKKPAAQLDIAGTASVIDGDTIEIHGQRIRLNAIDAPESRQTCLQNGRPWRCGQAAAIALADKIGRMPVRCEQVGFDRYQRIVGRCYLGEEDLASWLVAEGLAVAHRQYGRDYVAQEAAAKTASKGVWATEFVMPWEWRRGQR